MSGYTKFCTPSPKRGPFSGYYECLEINQHTHASLEGLTRKTIFPDKFSVPGFGTIHTGQSLAIDEATRSMLQHGRQEVTLYGLGTQYGHLKPTDVALVDGQTSRSAEKLYIKVTNIRTMKAELLLKQSKDNPTMLHDMERQIGRALKASEKVRVVEAVAIYEWQIDQNRPLI